MDIINPEENLDRIDSLLSALLDNDLADDETLELNDMLLADADARTRYLDYAMLHADLMVYFRGGLEKESTEAAFPSLPSVSDMGSPSTFSQ